MEQTIKSIAELERFADEFLEKLPTDTHSAMVVGLSGELGSGKTAFVKALAKALGVEDEVLSPTFVIAKFYETHGRHPRSRLVHIDAYRIEHPDELKVLRWGEIIADPHNLVVVEWPENLGEAFPPNAPIHMFRFVDETTRVIKRTLS